MKLLLCLCFVFTMGTVYSHVEAFYEDGWRVRVMLETPPQAEFPLVLTLYGKGITNSVFLLEEKKEYTDQVEVPDGDYAYRLSGRGKTIENGRLSLKSRLTVNLAGIAGGKVRFLLRAENPVFVESYIYRDDFPVRYSRFTLAGEKEMEFAGLESGKEYRSVWKTGGFSRTLTFIAPPVNCAYQKPVSGTFNRLPESRYIDDTTPAITRVNDGRVEWFSGTAVSEEVTFREQFVLVDLLDIKSLKTGRVVWNANYYPLRYYWVWSTDGRTWKETEREASAFHRITAPDNTPSLSDEFPFEEKARYVGIRVKKGEEIFARQKHRKTLHLMELEAYE